MLWDGFLAGLQVGIFTSATLTFIFCAVGMSGGGVGYVIFIALTFCFSAAVGTLFKLIDILIKEDE